MGLQTILKREIA